MNHHALVDQVYAKLSATQMPARILQLVRRRDDGGQPALCEIIAQKYELVLRRQVSPIKYSHVGRAHASPIAVGCDERLAQCFHRVWLAEPVLFRECS